MSSKELYRQIIADGWNGLEHMVSVRRQESLHLEFKPKDPKTQDLDKDMKNKVSKVISGFANTEGGVLLLGVNSQRPADKGPDVATGLVPTLSAANFQDALNRHLVEIATPTVQGMETSMVPSSLNDGSGIVALYVPESMGKPHRAASGDEASGRYFLRTESSTVVMPHSLLGALFAQVTPPRLRMIAKFEPNQTGDVVHLWVTNIGKGAARNVALRCDLSSDSGWIKVTDITSLWRKRMQRHPDGSTSMLWEYGEILYPDDTVEVIYNRVMVDKTTPQRGQPTCVQRLKGSIYSSNGPTVHFDEKNLVLGMGQEPVMFPSDGE